MHFPIIELTSQKKTPKEIKESSLDYDDALLNYFCDYFGEPYTSSERTKTIRIPWLKTLFAGIAEVDEKEECIRFFSKEKICESLDRHYDEVVESIVRNRELAGWLKFYNLRQYGFDFRDSGSIFVVDGCAKTSMMFFEDSYYFADKVLYFGQIYDAHC